MIMHDAPTGPLTKCQITNSENLFEILDLGIQPPCGAMLSEDDLAHKEKMYPLKLVHCPESGLAQLSYVVDGQEIYHKAYPYRSGISKPLAEYQKNFASNIIMEFGLREGTFCLDIGSNDGTLLSGFMKHNMKVLGVEPTNIAQIAQTENNVPTLQKFFNENVSDEILEKHGKAKIIICTNSFAHMAELGEVCRGIANLLDEDGIFISESHYLLDILEKFQFDTIYHEHIRTYSLKSLITLLSYYDLEVFHAQRASRYGGNIRVYASKKGKHPIRDSIRQLLEQEEKAGLHDATTWKKFTLNVEKNKKIFMDFLYKLKASNKTIAGYSCPGRCVPLINYYQITKNLIPYIGELPTSLKLGKYVPGARIPVVSTDVLAKEQPDYLVVFAWHYIDAIKERLKEDGVHSKLIVALPEFQVFE